MLWIIKYTHTEYCELHSLKIESLIGRERECVREKDGVLTKHIYMCFVVHFDTFHIPFEVTRRRKNTQIADIFFIHRQIPHKCRPLAQKSKTFFILS